MQYCPFTNNVQTFSIDRSRDYQQNSQYYNNQLEEARRSLSYSIQDYDKKYNPAVGDRGQLNTFQKILLNELFYISQTNKEYTDDLEKISKGLKDLENRRGIEIIPQQTFEQGKKLLLDRQYLQDRYNQYYKNLNNFLQKDNILPNDVDYAKNTKELLQNDRAIIMSKFYNVINTKGKNSTIIKQTAKNILDSLYVPIQQDDVTQQMIAEQSTRIDQNQIQSQDNINMSQQQHFSQILNQSQIQNNYQLQNQNDIQQNQFPINNSQIIDKTRYIQDISLQIDQNFKQSTQAASEIKMELAGLDDALMNGKVSQLTKVFRTMLPEGDKEIEMMTEEELKLIRLITIVGDANRLLRKLPINSEIYVQKLQQINRLNQIKDDLEKIVQEQRYQKKRESYNASGKPDPEKERQLKIRSQLVEKLNNLHTIRKYTPVEGFTIFWDWVVNIPKRYSSAKLQWGLFKRSEVIVPPQFLEQRPLSIQSFNTKYTVWGDRDHVYDVKANKDILIVIELQCFYMDPGSKVQMDVYGWSILELFDMNLDLMRGKWKIPFYSTKINPNVLVSQAKTLQSQSNTMLHLRICFPQDLEFGDEYPLHPWTQGNEFFLPVIHKKTVVQASIELDLTKQRQTASIFNDQIDSSSESSEESEEDDKGAFTQAQIEAPKVDLWKPIPYPDQRRGLHVTIHNLLRYLKDRRSKIKCYLIDVKRGVIKDDMGRDCQFETDVYDPLRRSKENKNTFAQLEDLNLVQEGITVVEEDYHFFVDIVTYAHNNRAHGEIYLLFQVYSNKYSIQSDSEDSDDNNTQKKGKENEENTKKEKNKSKILIEKAWYAFSLFEKEICQIGHYYKNIFDTPIQKPPFDMQKINYFQNSEIDFSINFFDYTKDNLKVLDQKYRDLRDLRRQMRKKPKQKKVKVKIQEDLYGYQKVFLENKEIQYLDKPFEKGYGIDFYVDSARFLPDNVTVCKISVAIINQNFDKFFDQDTALPDLSSETYSPKFNFRKELRATHFDPTLQAFMVIQTIDNMNKEVRIVGYSIINFFLNRKTKKQPTSQLDNDIILQNGNYQIPIFCQHPRKMDAFNVEKLSILDKLPCASLLVRIVNAPLSQDGFRAISINDVAKQDWEKVGIWVPAPPYNIGKQSFYNTSYYILRDSEKELFELRYQRVSPPQVDLLNTVANVFAQKEKEKNKSTQQPAAIQIESVKQGKEWIDKNIVRTPYTDIIELQYFAKYKPSAGFKFSLDGFHNNPNTDNPIVGIYCLNPPATYYFNTGEDKGKAVMLNSAYNWDSPLNSPQFTEGYFTFTGVEFNKNLCIIIDCRKVVFSKKADSVFSECVSWTICPVFTPNGYVKSGIYQIPMFKGQVPYNVIETIQKQDPWEFIEEQLQSKKSSVKYYENMSCVVRLLDAQRDGHYQTPFDESRLNYKYIPKDRIGDYAYNAAIQKKLEKATKMISLVHNKAKPNEYQDKLTNLTLKVLSLT